MKKAITRIVTLMFFIALIFTGCGSEEEIIIPAPEASAHKAELDTSSNLDVPVHDPTEETEPLGAEGILQETAEYMQEEQIQEVTVHSETYIDLYGEEEKTDPDWRLKNRLTAAGNLGDDYPLISGYGPRDDYGGQISAIHKGLDFAMDEGTRILSPGKCRVAYTGYSDARGLWMVIYWGHGYYILLQHLSEILTETGCFHDEGDVLALSGNTGASLMPHLHLEILQDDEGDDTMKNFNDGTRCVNPYFFIFGLEDIN